MTAKASANTDNALTAAVARARPVRFVRTKKKQRRSQKSCLQLLMPVHRPRCMKNKTKKHNDELKKYVKTHSPSGLLSTRATSRCSAEDPHLSFPLNRTFKRKSAKGGGDHTWCQLESKPRKNTRKEKQRPRPSF